MFRRLESDIESKCDASDARVVGDKLAKVEEESVEVKIGESDVDDCDWDEGDVKLDECDGEGAEGRAVVG